VLNRQRTVIYTERTRVLAGEDLSDQTSNMLDDVISAYVKGATSEGYAEDWDLEQLWTSLKQLYPVGFTIEDIEDEAGGSRDMIDSEFLEARLLEDARSAYAAREEELTSDAMREFERLVLLQVIDRKWREHLYEMDYLQEGIGLRAHAQRDPLVEYQREGFDMFSQMLDGIKEEVVGFLFNMEVQVEEAPPAPPVIDTQAARLLPETRPVAISAKGLGNTRQSQALSYSSPTIDGAAGSGSVAIEQAPALGLGRSSTPPARPSGPQSARSAGEKMPAPGQVVGSGGPSRNAPCPCGSGKKYKRCHGAPAGA
jgi:preprotein translocase subunit SecA